MTTHPQFGPQPQRKSNAGKIVAIIAAVVGVLCLSGVILAACVGSSVDNRAEQLADQDAANRDAATAQTTTAPTSPAATTPPAAATTTAPAAPAKPTKTTPAPVLIGDGVYTVGEDMPAGRYKVTERADDLCYWSRTKNDNIVDNGIGGGFPTFTARKGEQVEISSCPDFKLLTK